MESLNLEQDDKLVHCPYNPSHVMPYKSFSKHLFMCREKPLKPVFKNCFFNSLHILPEDEIEEHEKNCLDRPNVDNVLFEPEDFKRPIPIFQNEPAVNYNGKPWYDEECSTTIKNLTNKPVLMKPIFSLTKSESKQKRSAISSLDLLYDKNISIQDRLDASINSQAGSSQVKQTFFGKKPNV